MEEEFPKRYFRSGDEPQVDHINNNCKFSAIKKIKKALPTEYKQVKTTSVFANILAIFENGLHFSATTIHSMMCRQLLTQKKYEFWCVFGGRPLRFSLQEFYAVTGLKYKVDNMSTAENSIKYDNGFWSTLLKDKINISIKDLTDKHLKAAKGWSPEDKLRFVYVGIIASLVVARDEKAHIPHKYIKLVMDTVMLESYPWGHEAFECLITSIINKRGKLKRPKSYTLDGLSYAFQIWVMEAIPLIGNILGKRISKELIQFPRCSNWTGAAKISYSDIIRLERKIQATEAPIYPYISFTGNFDTLESADYLWSDEVNDVEVGILKSAINMGTDFKEHIWESIQHDETFISQNEQVGEEVDYQGLEEENENANSDDSNNPISESRSRKKRVADIGAEQRKKLVLCQQTVGLQQGISEETKSFIQGIFNAAFSSLEAKLEKIIDEKMGKLESDYSQFKNSVIEEIKNAETTTVPKPSIANKFQPKVGVSKKTSSLRSR